MEEKKDRQNSRKSHKVFKMLLFHMAMFKFRDSHGLSNLLFRGPKLQVPHTTRIQLWVSQHACEENIIICTAGNNISRSNIKRSKFQLG